jgi:hypothetical protein
VKHTSRALEGFDSTKNTTPPPLLPYNITTVGDVPVGRRFRLIREYYGQKKSEGVYIKTGRSSVVYCTCALIGEKGTIAIQRSRKATVLDEELIDIVLKYTYGAEQ